MKKLYKLGWIFLALFLAGAGLFWSRGWLTHEYQKYFINRTIKGYVDQLAPHLPFKIVKAEIDVPSLSAFYDGKITNLLLVLEWQGHEVRLEGPLNLDYNSKEKILTLTYPTRGHYEQNTFTFTTWAVLDRNFKLTQEKLNIPFHEIGMIFHADLFKVNPHTAYGVADLTFNQTNLSGIWKDGQIASGASFNSLEVDLKQGKETLTTQVGATRFNAVTPFEITEAGAPLITGKIQGTLHSQGGEALRTTLEGDQYLDYSLIQNWNTQFTADPTSAQITVKSPKDKKQAQFSLSRENITYFLPPLDLSHLLSTIQDATQKQFLPDLTLQAGQLLVRGHLNPTTLDGTHDIKIQGFKALHPASQTVIDQMDLALIVKNNGTTNFSVPSGEIKIQRLANRGAQIGLKPLRFSVDQDGTFNHQDPVELTGLPFLFNLQKITGNIYQQNLKTSLTASGIGPKTLEWLTCFQSAQIPPFETRAQFEQITWNQGSFTTLGSVDTDFFDGKIRLDQVSALQLASAVPEIKFSLEWSKIDLEKLMAWLKFGQIRGTLEGHLKNVTLQKWLPTHFDFHIEGRPFAGETEIELDSKAMENFLTIVLSEEMMEDMLGTFAGFQHWVMFGGFSNFFGGYDLQLAALSARSSDGIIHLETHEPPDLKKSKNNERYILYGDRFKMPLNKRTREDKTYPIYSYEPLDIDATVAANYTYKMLERFGRILATLTKSQQDKNEANPSQENESNEPPTKKECIPLEFQ